MNHLSIPISLLTEVPLQNGYIEVLELLLKSNGKYTDLPRATKVAYDAFLNAFPFVEVQNTYIVPGHFQRNTQRVESMVIWNGLNELNNIEDTELVVVHFAAIVKTESGEGISVPDFGSFRITTENGHLLILVDFTVDFFSEPARWHFKTNQIWRTVDLKGKGKENLGLLRSAVKRFLTDADTHILNLSGELSGINF